MQPLLQTLIGSTGNAQIYMVKGRIQQRIAAPCSLSSQTLIGSNSSTLVSIVKGRIQQRIAAPATPPRH
jgi:hypothetical protein